MAESPKNDTIALTSFSGEICHVKINYRGQLESVNNYDRISTLGEGTYGLVSLASEIKTGRIRAIKALKEQQGRDLDVCVLRETKLLSSLRHPNIIGLYGVLAGSSIRKTYLVMEICQQDLDRYLRNTPDFLSTYKIHDLFKQLLKGLDFLHRAFIIHRDLKPANILLSEDGVLKIADFGLARRLALSTDGYMTPGVVTLWYRSPELLLSCLDYDHAVDMWSAGCILAELYLLSPVLQAESELSQLHLICDLLGSPSKTALERLSDCGVSATALCMIPKDRPCLVNTKLQSKMSSLAFELLSDLLAWDPTFRFTAHQALKSDFIARY